MASINFTDGITPVPASWLNEVDSVTQRFKPSYMSGMGRMLSLKETEWLSITDFPGVVGDGVTDCYAPLLAGLAALPRFSGTVFEHTWYDVLQTLVVPGGAFYFSDTLNLEQSVRFFGCGSPGGNQLGASRFIFPANKHGIITHAEYTSPSGHAAEGIRFEGICFCTKVYHDSGTLTRTGNYHAIWARTRTILKDCVIAGFSGDGYHVYATAPSGWSSTTTYGVPSTAYDAGGNLVHSLQVNNLNHPTTDPAWWAPGPDVDAGNANSWGFDNLVVLQCWGNAVAVSGADANAGYGFKLDARACGGSGIYSNSFLGNTYTACHVSGCSTRSCVTYGGHNWQCLNGPLGASTVPGTNSAVWFDLGAGGGFQAWSGSGTYIESYSYWSDNDSARDIYTGCYLEGGYAWSKIISPSTCIGGANDFHMSPFMTAYIDCEGELNERTIYQIGSGRKRSMKWAPNDGVILELRDKNESLGAYPWRQKMATGRTYWDWANSTRSLLEFTNSQATVANGFPRDVAARTPDGGGIGFREGFFIGLNMKFVSTGTAAPSTGTYVVGDTVINEAPSVLGTAGSRYMIDKWRCTVAGTPGTWVECRTLTGT